LSRSESAHIDKTGPTDTEKIRVTSGVRGASGLKGHPDTILMRTKTTSAASARQFVRRDLTVARRLIANGAVLAKSLVYLSLFGFVSAIALIYKYLLTSLTYVMARVFPAKIDRDEVIKALHEVEKDTTLND
jgi:hypothetical protein